MVGHVDSADGPAVFTDLDDLAVGDVIDVESSDGGIVSFAVSSVTRPPKHAFPTEAVYGPMPDSELHLITCGGSFDRETGYTDNVVVTAPRSADAPAPQRRLDGMCRSIKTLRVPYTEHVSDNDFRAAALQYVRKISGFHAPAVHKTDAFGPARPTRGEGFGPRAL